MSFSFSFFSTVENQKITLKGLEFHAFHGCTESERLYGNRFIVDFETSVEAEKGCKSDDIEGTEDYCRFYAIIKREMAIPSKLLENVAWRILNAINKEVTGVCDGYIRITKLNVPFGGQPSTASASFTLEF